MTAALRQARDDAYDLFEAIRKTLPYSAPELMPERASRLCFAAAKLAISWGVEPMTLIDDIKGLS